MKVEIRDCDKFWLAKEMEYQAQRQIDAGEKSWFLFISYYSSFPNESLVTSLLAPDKAITSEG